MFLSEVNLNTEVVVKKTHGEGVFKRKIMDMGITKGAVLKIKKIAPLGDPIDILVRGYDLSLRKIDAKLIEVDNV